MAVSVDWITRIITVPRADMVIVQASPEIREHDLNDFRLELLDLQDDTEGMPWTDTHRHNLPVILGGITYARVLEIINNYTVEYEDGLYAVNLVGANSNVSDVAVVNQVSIRSSNSAGLIQQDVWAVDLTGYIDPDTAGAILKKAMIDAANAYAASVIKISG